jgi:hypothetical protein
MKLLAREGNTGDFDTFFDCLYPAVCDSPLREIVREEWMLFCSEPATLTLVVEDFDLPPKERLVAAAQTVFVSEEVVKEARHGYRPWLKQWIVKKTHSLKHHQRPPLLPLDTVAQMHREDGVHAFVGVWAWKQYPNDLPQEMRVRTFLDNAFALLTRGFHYETILVETVGVPARDLAASWGIPIWNRYESYYASREAATMTHHDRYHSTATLLGLTRRVAERNEGGRLAPLFFVEAPQLELNEDQQRLAALALDQFTNTQIAASLDKSERTIKRWWNEIYTQYDRVFPTHLPARNSMDEETESSANKARSEESRRIVLAYLELHPQEIRPYGRRRFRIGYEPK